MNWRHDTRVGMSLLFFGLFVLCTTTEAKQQRAQFGVPASEFALAVEGELISLKAEMASLEAILTAMEKQMGIEVMSEIPKRESITTDFEGLSLAEAMHHLGLNF